MYIPIRTWSFALLIPCLYAASLPAEARPEAQSPPGENKTPGHNATTPAEQKTETKEKQSQAKTPGPQKNESTETKKANEVKKPEAYLPTEAEIEAAEKRIELRQATAELVVAYKYQIRHTVPGLMKRLEKIAPESAEFRYFEALQLYEQGERGRALVKLDESVYRSQHFSRAWNLKGIILSEANRLAESRVAFEKAVEHNPYNPNYVYNLASVLYRLELRDASLEVAQHAIRLKPNLAEAYYLKGRIYSDIEQAGQALLAYKEAQRYGAGGPDFLLDYMLVAEAAGDAKIVPDLADQLSNTRDPRTLRELGRVHAKFGEYKEASKYLSRLIALPEASPADRRNYVFALHNAKANTKYWIYQIPKLDKKEREALLEYLAELEKKNRETPGTRDPMLKPIK